MTGTFNHKKIEKKWQKKWAEEGIYQTKDNSQKPKFYCLDMFPYPSGEGLHVGHPKGYIATDIISRYKRMNGHNVLHPMGWDAFGLPAENYALKHKIHPETAVKKNIKNYKRQLKLIGFDYDWSREINTTDPDYYRWTQWIFLQLYKAGLVYESYEPINWCPSCQTGLANEDLEDGRCERCDSEIEKKPMRQWVLKITDYAERLLSDLDDLAWPESIKEAQRNWIGKSQGAEIDFSTSAGKTITVFTTRPDTLFGTTYLVLAPEHPLIAELKSEIKNYSAVEKYITQAGKKSEIDRIAEGRIKTGVKLVGLEAINPANGEAIPIFIADFVLNHYGTGAIMSVPAHDERDYAFAQKYKLPIRQVVAGDGEVYLGEGELINSDKFSGLNSSGAKKKITKAVGGRWVNRYKLRDWVFSRQRYWGEPIPLIHCQACGVVPIAESDLPLKLPTVKNYAPSGTGESPLATMDSWLKTECPKCQGPAKRETNTMPQWAGSSWYYLRYIDPKNDQALISQTKANKWLPVDMYIGGTEHATRHLIYARFWHKFLYDQGVVSQPEPFAKIGKSLGLILGEDGRKMSKRWGNVVNPDEMVEKYGADTLRVYLMFMGPFEFEVAWSTKDMIGSRRFLEKIWRLRGKLSLTGKLSQGAEQALHQTIKKVESDINDFSFNTAISTLMTLLNLLDKEKQVPIKDFKIILKLLAPFAPHLTEEIWQEIKPGQSIHLAKWPAYQSDKLIAETVTIVIQINGKRRGEITAPRDITEASLLPEIKALPAIESWLKGKEIIKTIYVPNRLVNLVIR